MKLFTVALNLCFLIFASSLAHPMSAGNDEDPVQLSAEPRTLLHWSRDDFDLDPWYKCAAAGKRYLYKQTNSWGQITGVQKEYFDDYSDLSGNQADHALEVQVLIHVLNIAEITPATLGPDAKNRLKAVLNGLGNMFYVTAGTNGSKGATIRNILQEQEYNVRADVKQYVQDTCAASLDTARVMDKILTSYNYKLPITLEYLQTFLLRALGAKCLHLWESKNFELEQGLGGTSPSQLVSHI